MDADLVGWFMVALCGAWFAFMVTRDVRQIRSDRVEPVSTGPHPDFLATSVAPAPASQHLRGGEK